ncbi:MULTISPECIES: hypothetical protein [Niastella]|uniref:Uncharacterized protein n=1 Tax=Niastella soli TaxID=2821487 RepID=A0ABS3YUX7_9BACT|nr:hypothetical protein [Niastella soli]MBO9200996.1 hypothetical protein [Niastella soli]
MLTGLSWPAPGKRKQPLSVSMDASRILMTNACNYLKIMQQADNLNLETSNRKSYPITE